MQSAAMRDKSGGFTLLESLVAMGLIAAVLSVLAPVLFQVAKLKARDVGTIERDAVLRGESNRLAMLTFAALDAQAGCTEVTDRARFHYSRCVTVTAVSAKERSILIAVHPANAEVPADSVTLTRTRTSLGSSNPFGS